MSFLSRTSAIGLDIGPRRIAAAQLGARRSEWRLESGATVSRPSGATPDHVSWDEARRLADILSRQGFAGRDVVLAVPDARVMAAVLELPPRSSGAPIEQLARTELARTQRRDPGSFEIACWDLPAPLRGGETSHVMAAACAHEEAEAILDPLEAAGLRVRALDIRAWAMSRACERLLAGSPQVAALVQIGEASVVLALVRSGMVVYERLFPDASVGELRARVADRLGLEGDLAESLFESQLRDAGGEGDVEDTADLLEDHAQALAKELQTAINYADHRYGGHVERVILYGTGAVLRGLESRLARELNIAVAAARPGELLPCAPGLEAVSSDPALSVAIGLASHGLGRAA